MSLFADDLLAHARALSTQFKTRHHTIATAESCTGGLLSALLTELPGASACFTHGFITYANDAKIALGVNAALIAQHGAVSEPVAKAMAEAALRAAGSSMALAITGIAGPGGGTAQKPVGTVHIALAMRDGATQHRHHHFVGDRASVRLQAIAAALAMLSAAV